MKYLENDIEKNNILTILIMFLFLNACGAKLKKSREVNLNSSTLTEKVTNLCNQLQTQTVEPNLQNISLSNELCTKPAGIYAQNLNDIEKNQGVSFVVENTIKDINSKDKIFKLQTKTDIWVNKSLVSLLQIILPKISDNAEGLFKNKSQQQTQDQKFTLSIIGKPQLNEQKKELQLEAEISSTLEQNGQVEILNTFKVYAKVFEQSAVAKIITTKDAEYKDSIFKKFNILAIAIPHASDIYVTILTDFDVYSFGVDKIMEHEIKKTIAEGIKSIPELIKNLENENQ